MDMSTIESLPFQSKNNTSIDIKRKRKIQYRKPKGRFGQKSNGILNRSIYKQSQLSQSTNDGDEQLVAVRDVNSFLEKNKELAKALEESRSHLKQLQNEKFAFQSECNGLREKLSILQNATLTCSCKKNELESGDTNTNFFSDLQKSLKDILGVLNDHVTSLALKKCAKEALHTKLVTSSVASSSCISDTSHESQTNRENKPISDDKFARNKVNKKTQTLPIRLTKDSCVQLRNRKVQVNTPAICENCQLSKKSLCNKSNQTIHNSSSKVDTGSQCDLREIPLMKQSKVVSRFPFSNLTQQQTDLQLRKTDVRSILKPQKNKFVTHAITPLKVNQPRFEIFVDDQAADKENLQIISADKYLTKKVRIQSPAQIHLIEYNGDNNDDGVQQPSNERLRHRKKNINYKEPSLNRRLISDGNEGHAIVSRSRKKATTKRTSRKKKLMVNRSINLQELITSVLEESFRAILEKE